MTPTPVDTPRQSPWKGWITRIQEREKVFEKGWWKQAEATEKMYEGGRADGAADDNPFNILYANTEVLLPALYSNTPRPDVTTRFKGGQQAIAEICRRFLTTVIDMSQPGTESFDSAMIGATLGGLVPGLGYARIRAYPDQPCPIRVESGTWDSILWGHAKKWARVPWVAFRHKMTKDDVIAQFPKLTPEQKTSLGLPSQKEEDGQGREDRSKPVWVYELWIKEERKTVWLTDAVKDGLLEEVEDLLQLQGFYPLPGPLTFVTKPSNLNPTPLYEYYRDQARELNQVTVRLKNVLSAIKVRGCYNPILGKDIVQILDPAQMENGLVPSNAPMDLQGKGFEAHIWFMPLEQLIIVAKELYGARLQIMQVIQQITGLSDIVRGSTVASETATAQNLKNKWGTLRLQQGQDRVAKYARDLLRLAVDAATSVLNVETWKKLTQLPFPTEQEKMVLIQQAQAQAMQAQQTVAMGQPPPPADPRLQLPTWEALLSQLKDDGGRVYIINIETNSTVSASASEDKADVAEFMNAMGQLLAGLAPLAQIGPSGLEVAKELLLAVTSKFRFGREVEESLQKLQVPGPGGPDPMQQAQQQQAQAESAAAVQKLQNEMELDKAQHAMKMQQIQMDAEVARSEFQLNQVKIAAQHKKLQTDMQLADAKVAVAKQKSANG